MKLKIVPDINKITKEWSIERIVSECPPPTWEHVFENARNELKDISDILEEDRIKNGPRLPSNKDLFRAFWLTPLKDIRVVIIGQDVYHSIINGTPLATGLAFSVPKGVSIPSSLQNIYKELKSCIPEFNVPQHGDLSSWARKQGIFLYNSSLTVRQGEPGCHGRIWDGFTKKVINAIINENPNCIFVAWGAFAQKVAKNFVGNKATILNAPHPSGLSAHRGFIGCKHFSQINEILVSKGKTPIDWNVY